MSKANNLESKRSQCPETGPACLWGDFDELQYQIMRPSSGFVLLSLRSVYPSDIWKGHPVPILRPALREEHNLYMTHDLSLLFDRSDA
jgi:hypothetical protein